MPSRAPASGTAGKTGNAHTSTQRSARPKINAQRQFGSVQTSVRYTFVDGSNHFTGGAFSPLASLLWIIATVLIGRLWRLPSVWRRRRAATRTP